MGKNTITIGDRFISNRGSECTVIGCLGRVKGYLVRHDGAHQYESIVHMSGLKTGKFKNPYHPSVHGVGFVGVGDFKSRINGKRYAAYEAWLSMLQRCYSSKFHTKNQCYIGCSVDERWHNLQTFAKWYTTNDCNINGHQLDKDILVSGNKVYSPETCCLVPRQINTIVIHKDANCSEFREVVHKYKNEIAPDVFKALMNRS